MNRTICAYCGHNVELVPTGVCPFCGGNLAEEGIEEIDECENERFALIKKYLIGVSEYKTSQSRKSRKEIIDIFRPVEEEEEEEEEEEKYIEYSEKEISELDTYTKTILESDTVKTVIDALKPSPFALFKHLWVVLPIICAIGIIGFFMPSFIEWYQTIITITPPTTPTEEVDIRPLMTLVMSLIPIIFLLAILKKFSKF